jgi:hypothetical protein
MTRAGELGRLQLKAIVRFLWQAGPGINPWIAGWAHFALRQGRPSFFAPKRASCQTCGLPLSCPLNAVTNARFLSYAGPPAPGPL